MKMNHFDTPIAARQYITDSILWDLREDLARMTGSEAECYTDADCAALEGKIADIVAVSQQ